LYSSFRYPICPLSQKGIISPGKNLSQNHSIV
jgi:hypothetical protein